jgi:tetratricopeptide (TPR) repeat protein
MIARAVLRTGRPAIAHRVARPRIRVDHRPAADALRAALIAISLAAAVSAAPRAQAANADAMSRFSEAGAAFHAEDYSKSRALFEQALAAGMEGPAIHYNIGAAAYLGGDLPRAERAFREVARTPEMAALAHYNLGLVALERRDEREAREWFNRAIHEDVPDERLRTLVSSQLAELPEPRARGAWSYYTRGGLGHDDNVALRSSSVESSATGDEDSYGELVFAGSYSIGNWRIDTAGGTTEYMKLDEFSQSAYSLGAARGFRSDNWYVEAGAYGSQFSLGGEVFERSVAASALVTRFFSNGSRLRAQLRAASVTGKGAFSGLTGERTELGLYYDRHWREWNFGVHTRGEINDSEDTFYAGQWVQLGVEARYAWTPTWGFMAGAALRRTMHRAQLTTVNGWDDDRATLQLGATRALWKQTQLFVRYEHERNDSPVAGYHYDRNRVVASVELWR